jgi:predicted nucleotidyltransferase component of viral defense system
LKIIRELNLPFYLTGGTALSRAYFNHRYSDDLDLFVNNDDNFNAYVELFYKSLLSLQTKNEFEIDYQKIIRTEYSCQFFIVKKDLSLKIDLVNDLSPYFGKINQHNLLGKVDNLRNILSNKITALYRYEVKDIVDLWVICKNYQFNYRHIINEAQSKEAGIDPISLYEIISSFPISKLELIKWIKKPDFNQFKNDLEKISDDLLKGRDNTIA